MIETEDKLKTQKASLHIFGTSINSTSKVQEVCDKLYKMEAIKNVNVDLDDWENVLRIECHVQIETEKLNNIITAMGFYCYDL